MGFKRSVQKLRKQYAKKNIDPPIEGKFHKCLNETLNDAKFKLKKGKVSRVFYGYIDVGDGCWRQNVLVTESLKKLPIL